MAGPTQPLLREKPASPTWLITLLGLILAALVAVALLYHPGGNTRCLRVSAVASGDQLALLVRNTCNQPVLLESVSIVQNGAASLRELRIRLEPGETRVLTFTVHPDAPVSLRLQYRLAAEETMVLKVEGR